MTLIVDDSKFIAQDMKGLYETKETIPETSNPRCRSRQRPSEAPGFSRTLESEPDFELICASLSDLDCHAHVDIILLGNQRGQRSFEDVVKLKTVYPDAQIIAIGSGMHDETILAALECGAKGYVDEGASAVEFISAVRAVSRGSVWVSRHLLSMFVERACGVVGSACFDGSSAFTAREKEVLEMLVDGRSNREIGVPLGIAVRTVKAHVARLMCKVGVRNRIALSTYAISHSLVSDGQDLSNPSSVTFLGAG